MKLIDRMQAEPWRFDFLHMFCGSSNGQRRSAAHRRQRGPSRGVYRSWPGSLLEFPASNLAVSTRTRGPLKDHSSNFSDCLGRRVRCRSRRPTRASLVADARRRLPALPRSVQWPLPSTLLPGVGQSRPIGQHDRPAQDRFIAYIGSVDRLRLRPYQQSRQSRTSPSSALPDCWRPRRNVHRVCRGFLRGLFGVKVEIDEFVGSWLTFDARRSYAARRKHATRWARMLCWAPSVFSVEGQVQDTDLRQEFCAIRAVSAGRSAQSFRASRRRRILLHRRRTRLGRGAGHSSRRGRRRSSSVRAAAGLDHLGVTQLDVTEEYRRCPISSQRALERQTSADAADVRRL